MVQLPGSCRSRTCNLNQHVRYDVLVSVIVCAEVDATTVANMLLTLSRHICSSNS